VKRSRTQIKLRLAMLTLLLCAATSSCESKLNVSVKKGSGCRATQNLQSGTCVDNTVGVKLVSDKDGKAVTGSFDVSAVFAEAVSGFEVTDLALTNAAVKKISTTDQTTFTFTVEPAAAGSVQVSIPKDVAVNGAGSKNAASNVVTVTYALSSATSTSSSAAYEPFALQAISDFLLPYNVTNFALDLMVNGTDSAIACDDTALSVTSSNSSIIATSGISWTGTQPRCQAIIASVPNATGTTTLTFTARNSKGASVSRSAVATVSSSMVFGSNSLEYIDRMRYELNNPQSVTVAEGKLFAVDSGNRRVQVWSKFPTDNYLPADFSLVEANPGISGQNNISPLSSANIIKDQYSIHSVSHIFNDGVRLIVTDTLLNRVLIWNSIPTSAGIQPDVVIGQSNFSSSGNGTTSTSLYWPVNSWSDGTRLFITDYGNNRVLIWNTFPTTNGQPAGVVVGQPNMTSSSPGYSASLMLLPSAIGVYQNKLFVGDSGRRILIWNAIPTSNGASANVVIGQPDFTSSSSLTTAANTLESTSKYFAFANGMLFVSDPGNSRILIFNSIPTSNFASADLVLGQSGLIDNSVNRGQASPSLDSLKYPQGINVFGNKLVVADSGNSRVLIWNTLPTENGAPADLVIGAPNGTTDPSAIRTSSTRQSPYKTAHCGTRMYAVDTSRHRVLVWNNFSNQSNIPADFVLGQTNFNTSSANTGGVTASTLNYPSGVHCDGTRLFVADAQNNRVLIWNTFPSTFGQAADIVVGQSNMTSTAFGPTATTLTVPTAVWSTGSTLYIADRGNHRVLKYNSIPSSNGAAASVAIGQPNLTTGSLACSGAKLNGPTGVMVVGTKVIVADASNHRVAIWNSIPGASGVALDVVIGQPNNTTCTGGLSSSLMNSPGDVASDGTKLYVADRENNRVLVFSTIPTATGTAASSVYGQVDFTSAAPSGIVLGSPRGKLTASTLTGPNGISVSGGYLFISDASNQRLLAVPSP
jgi:hypothetical protein